MACPSISFISVTCSMTRTTNKSNVILEPLQDSTRTQIHIRESADHERACDRRRLADGEFVINILGDQRVHPRGEPGGNFHCKLTVICSSTKACEAKRLDLGYRSA